MAQLLVAIDTPEPLMSFARAALEKRLADQLSKLDDLGDPCEFVIDTISTLTAAWKAASRVHRPAIKRDLDRALEERQRMGGKVLAAEYRIKRIRVELAEMG
jgi:hypothetical protein